MSSVTPIVTLLWGGLCTVWVILLLAQHRLRRQGLLLAATPAEPCPRDQQAWPPVHAVIPARNEAQTIESCVRHLLAQDYPNLRVVVVNDRSEDDTAERVERIARLDSRLQLRTVRSLPEGWLAKSHALWLGTRELTLGEFDGDAWLLFIDADATLGMGAVRSAVVEAQRRGADLLTLFPRNAALGFWEHLIIPLCGGIVALWFARPGRPFANGQFLLVRRATYERVGGHAAVRDALIEDVPLAEACAASGATIVTAGGAELLGVRMYDSFGGVCDGWTRIFAGALRSPLKLIVSLLWLTFGSLLPHVALPPLIAMTIAAPNGATLLLLTLCLQHLALIYLVSYRFWSMGRCDRRYLWLYPASVLIVSGLLVRAIWMLTVGRTVTWRGVHYRLDGHARLRPLSSTHLERRSFVPRRPALTWAAWVVLAVIAAAGLRNYRVDNSLDTWLPELRATGPYPSYAVIGWETSRVSREQVVARVNRVSGVAVTIDRDAVAQFGRLSGVTPEDFVVSPDGSYEGAFVFRDRTVTDADFVSSLLTTLSPLREVAIGGPAVYAVTLDRVSQQRMPIVMAAITLLGLVLSWPVTGSLRAAAAGVAAITIGQVILVGGLAWSGLAMDMSVMMVPPLMMALGLSYISHRAIGRVDMRVLALCAATSALGIGSFALAPLPPIRSFALAGACGLALTWLAVITLVPRTPARRRRRLRLPGLKLAAFVRRRYGVKVMVATALILVTFPFLAAELRFASDPLNYFPPSDPAVQAFDVLDRKLTGMLPFQVTSPDPAARSLLEQTPGVRKVIDISAPPSGGARTYWCLADNAALPRLAAATPRWAEWARTRGTSIEWRGVAAQLHAAEQILRRLAIGSLLGMAAVATIAILLRTRRPVLATLTGLVTLVPIALLAGIMAALDIPVNLTSLMIGAISVGFAVDDVLHITCATLARGSVQRALVSCWRPCVGSSMINVACMACFALSPFRPTQQFGLLLASAAGLAMLSNQIVLPTLLSLLLSIGGRSRRAPRRAPVAADGPIQVPPELRPTDGSSASPQPGQGSCPPRLLWR